MTEQNRQRVDFISAATHKLKTSLTAIIASAELLNDEFQLDERGVEGKLILSIIRNAHSIDEELSRLSKMARVLGGDFQLHLEPIEIGQVIHNVVAQFYPVIQRRRQSLTLELPDFLPLVKADRLYLEQIVQTLIANASKFTPEQGKIKVSTHQDGNSLVVEVGDTGVGIPAEEQERIFRLRYQIKQDEAKKPSGNGLGLAIIKPLVELHGGKIWLRSIVGQGSTFFFSLPLVEM